MLGSGCGSLLGAVIAAFTTEYLSAHYAYGAAAASSLFVTCVACCYKETTESVVDVDAENEEV